MSPRFWSARNHLSYKHIAPTEIRLLAFSFLAFSSFGIKLSFCSSNYAKGDTSKGDIVLVTVKERRE